MEQPSFYSILTADVRYCKDLSDFQKILYSEITALSNKWGYCTAANKYFADLYDRDTSTISRSISKLQLLGFLIVEFESLDCSKRRIYPHATGKVIEKTLDEKVKGGVTKKSKAIDEKVIAPLDEKVIHNNTSINSKINSIETEPENEKIPPAERKVKEALLRAFKYFEQYPAQQEYMCINAGRKDAMHPEVWKATLEAWIRYNVDNQQIIQNIETGITKSFAAWLKRNLEANNKPKQNGFNPVGQQPQTKYTPPVNQKLVF